MLLMIEILINLFNKYLIIIWNYKMHDSIL